MSVSAVDTAIRKIREVVREWDEVELRYWREDHTRYGVIDPIIRALGRDTGDPKECHPEYPRPYLEGRVDYALFGRGCVQPAGVSPAKSTGPSTAGTWMAANPATTCPMLRRIPRWRPWHTWEAPGGV